MNRLFKKSVPLWAVVLIIAICVPLVIAVVIFTTPTATQTMKLSSSYNLELYYASEKNNNSPTSWILVPQGGVSMDWGMFNESQEQFWMLKVKNVGNIPGNVAWLKNGDNAVWTYWTLQVDMAGTNTAQGVTKPLAVGAEMTIKIQLKENTATAGQVYSFGVYVENRDTA